MAALLLGKHSTLKVCGLVLLLLGVGVHFYWLDGIVGAVAELTVADTEYAPGYSEWRFRHVVPGMAGDGVRELLGDPLRVVRFDTPGDETWLYTDPLIWDRNHMGGDCHYTERYVCLTNGVVTRVHHDFYVD